MQGAEARAEQDWQRGIERAEANLAGKNVADIIALLRAPPPADGAAVSQKHVLLHIYPCKVADASAERKALQCCH